MDYSHTGLVIQAPYDSVSMSMEGYGAGDSFAWEDALSRCICRGEAAPLVEVSMLRSREEVNIACDREVMP